MAAQTFTVTNLGNSSLVLDQFVFNTPAGIRHVANLVNFGGPEFFTSSEFTVTSPTLLSNQSKTFTVDHNYISGPAGTKTGNIEITSTTGKTFTICTNIVVGTGVGISSVTPTPIPTPSSTPTTPTPAPTPSPTPTTPTPTSSITPTYVLTTDAPYNTAKEGTLIRVNLITTNVLPGTEIPYTITGSQNVTGLFNPSDIDVPTSGSFVVDSQGKAHVDIGLVNDNLPSGDKVFILALTNAPDVTIPIIIDDIQT